jgi:hypothetical protein
MRRRILNRCAQGAKRPIIVYSSYERTTLTEVARVLPDLARTVAGIIKMASIGRRGSDRKLSTPAKVLLFTLILDHLGNVG